MKRLFLFTSLLFCTFYTNALTLNEALNVEVKKGIKAMNIESAKYYVKNSPDDEPYKYEFGSKQIIYADLNGDKIKDAVVLVTYCEVNACHMTTRGEELIVFIGQKNKQFKHAASKELGFSTEMKLKSNNIIELTHYGYRNSDSTCCPSKKSIENVKLINNKLITIKK